MRILGILSLLAISLVAQRVRIPQSPVVPQSVAYSVFVDGPTARVEMTMVLTNAGTTDATYDMIFPLGTEGVATGLQLTADGKVIEGRVYGAKEARRIYQAIVNKRRDPALLEHYGESMFRSRVFPVPAKGKVEVSLTYNSVLRPEGDLTRLHLPLTAHRHRSGSPKVTISCQLRSLHPITTFYSPTHELGKTTIRDAGTLKKTFITSCVVEPKGTSLDSDFVLYFKARGDQPLIDVSVLSERPSPSEDGYFLAVLNGIPVEDEAPEPRDVVFVLDRSGSMKGEKIKQAKAALKFLIERVRTGDRFNIVTYSNAVQVFESGMTNGSQDILSNALRFIEGVNADGGTNIQAALKVSLSLLADSKRLTQIVFLTDGLPTVGERDHRKLCAEVEKQNVAGTRIIAFGVGFDVNATFLDRLAVQNSGMSEYVLPGENIEEKVPDFYSRMQTPVLINTKLSFSGGGVHDVFPREVGDLYGGHQILLAGRYARSGPCEFIIEGTRRGQSVKIKIPIKLSTGARAGDQELIARIWAARKVGFLVDEIRLNGEDKELVASIIEIGTRFGILTEYTSFLAVESTDLRDVHANNERAELEFAARSIVMSGAHGVAQAANTKGMQRGQVVLTGNVWLGDDGRMVRQDGVQCVNGKALFNRRGVWQDPSIPKDAKLREVRLFSEEFFRLLDAHPWLNRVIARSGQLNCAVGGAYISFTASE